jgi:hypothetical protein
MYAIAMPEIMESKTAQSRSFKGRLESVVNQVCRIERCAFIFVHPNG